MPKPIPIVRNTCVKKGNTRLYQNYRMSSLINQKSPKQGHATSDSHQASKPGRTDRFQITEEYLEHQKELFHNFIDFKKTFDCVYHERLWRVFIRLLYDKATSAVSLNGGVVSVHQRTTALQLAVCRRHRSAGGGSEEELQQLYRKTGENCCWLRHGNQL